ncbi:hypothetical protein D3C75_1319690 [compost metagenome]
MILFHRKHYSRQYNSIINGTVYAGVGVKFTLSLLRNALIVPRAVPSPAQSLTVSGEAGPQIESKAEVRL